MYAYGGDPSSCDPYGTRPVVDRKFRFGRDVGVGGVVDVLEDADGVAAGPDGAAAVVEVEQVPVRRPRRVGVRHDEDVVARGRARRGLEGVGVERRGAGGDGRRAGWRGCRRWRRRRWRCCRSARSSAAFGQDVSLTKVGAVNATEATSTLTWFVPPRQVASSAERAAASSPLRSSHGDDERAAPVGLARSARRCPTRPAAARRRRWGRPTR